MTGVSQIVELRYNVRYVQSSPCGYEPFGHELYSNLQTSILPFDQGRDLYGCQACQYYCTTFFNDDKGENIHMQTMYASESVVFP